MPEFGHDHKPFTCHCQDKLRTIFTNIARFLHVIVHRNEAISTNNTEKKIQHEKVTNALATVETVVASCVMTAMCKLWSVERLDSCRRLHKATARE